MSHIEEDKIRINLVTGDEDKDALKDCYFYPTRTSGVYDFFLERSSTPLARGISSGGAFTFPLGVFSWVIPNPGDPSHPLVIKGAGPNATATGSWLNNNTSRKAPAGDENASIRDDDTGESGTFQAQAGSTIEGVLAAKA